MKNQICNSRRIFVAGSAHSTNTSGSVTVIEYINCHKIIVEFNDSRKYVATVSAGNLLKGRVKNPYYPNVFGVGYIGVGPYAASIGRNHTTSYKAWKAMMMRCYCEKSLSRNARYDGCYVCDEWLDFQVFSEWYVEHEHYDLGYSLDKDLLVPGNKVYSPSTCSLVPQELNSILSDRRSDRGAYPIGVVFDKDRNCFSSKLSENGIINSLGRYSTVKDAFAVYKKAKEAHVKSRANHWKDKIKPDVYDALMNWTVNSDIDEKIGAIA